jgi:hypothetical protein
VFQLCRLPLRRTDFGQTKVQNLCVASIGDEQVRRLNVPVDDAFRVRRVESIHNFDGDVEHLLQLHWSPTDGVLEGLALQILHRDEGFSILLPDVVDGADVGMVQGGCSFRLTAESL